MASPEPILDVVRGLSTVASFGIVITHIKQVWDEFFISKCDFCKGTGMITCRHCKGTKVLRTAPGVLSVVDSSYVDVNDPVQVCFFCPDVSKYDFNFEVEDEELDAYSIQDNLKAAMTNKPRPHKLPLLAGTQRCPECWGFPDVHRFTPNMMKVLNLDDPIFKQVQSNIARYNTEFSFSNRYSKVEQPNRKYLEYPMQPPKIPIETYKDPDLDGSNADGSMSAKDQLTLDDYILPYVDDSDTDED